MKKLTVTLALLCSAAAAACVKDGVSVFPTPGSVVPLNVRFILEGAGAEQDRVAALVGGALQLKAGEEVVSVRVTKGWTSSISRTAVVLIPTSPLKPNRTYVLALGAQLANAHVLNGNGAQGLSWRSGISEDRQAPKYQNKPAIAEGMHRQESGGLTRYLTLRAQLNEESPAYVVVSMQRVRGSSVKQVYAVPLQGGEARLGHDACSGSFSFDDGRAYRIAVETFDSAGNRAAERLPPIEANAPRAGAQ